ncbi:MAG: GTPase HflX [Candidatus Delongbacteria bacterium]|nr:MAG: GTPase HflX [Candidatus Delongbacteria bacterium]
MGDLDKSKAFLVSVCLPNNSYEEVESSLAELERLADTAGIETVGKFFQSRKAINNATYLGKGFLEELKVKMEMCDATLLIFDNELSPNQGRNIEKDFGIEAIDRTEVILHIFNDHAKTREARLQVSLATLQYQLPRLKRLWGHLDREKGTSAGSGGTSRGMGEKQIEVDKRLVRGEITKIKAQLEKLEQVKNTQRKSRDKIKKVALVGYTNAGKSTLFNRLTNAGVLVEDKLFATLDSTVRNYDSGINQPTILSDTVGFIANLPHHLVASFRATLKEVVGADLLLHVVDFSDRNFEKNIAEVEKVLKQIGADSIETLLVLNKIDNVSDYDMGDDELQERFSHGIKISAINNVNIEALNNAINDRLHDVEELDLLMPFSRQDLIAQVYDMGKVIDREFVDEGVLFKVILGVEAKKRLEEYIVS